MARIEGGSGDGAGQPVLPGMESMVPAVSGETKKKSKTKEAPKREKQTVHPIVTIPASLRNRPPAHRLDIDGFKDEE